MNKKTVIGGLVGVGLIGIIGYAILTNDGKQVQEQVEATATPLMGSEGESNIEGEPSAEPTPEFSSKVEAELVEWGYSKDIRAKDEKDMLSAKEYKKLYDLDCGDTIRKVIKSVSKVEFTKYDYMSAGEKVKNTYEYSNCTEDITQAMGKYDAIFIKCPAIVLGFNKNKVIVGILDDSGVKFKISSFVVYNYDSININTLAESDYKISIGDEVRNTIYPAIAQVKEVDGYKVVYQ